jgi:surfactin synthase thioesterase subunit
MNGNKWFAHCCVRENALNVVCFGYAGASASYFTPWAKSLPAGYSLFPVLLPQRETRSKEKMPDSLVTLAENFAAENKDLLTEPVVFFGHCTGAVVAYEAAKYMEKNYGASPVCLIASSSPSPSFTLLKDDVSRFTDSEFAGKLAEMGIIDKTMAANPVFLNYYMPIIRTDFDMHNKYSSGSDEKIKCPVICTYGSDDKLIEPDQIKDWERFTSAGSEYKAFAGEHFYLDNRLDEYLKYVFDEKIASLTDKK